MSQQSLGGHQLGGHGQMPSLRALRCQTLCRVIRSCGLESLWVVVCILR